MPNGASRAFRIAEPARALRDRAALPPRLGRLAPQQDRRRDLRLPLDRADRLRCASPIVRAAHAADIVIAIAGLKPIPTFSLDGKQWCIAGGGKSITQERR